MSAVNVHATVVILGTHGILIRGPSGSGKTTLSLTMMAMAGERHAALVGDDQVFVENRNGVLLAHHARPIAGQVEVFGLGPRDIDYRRAARIDLVVTLESEPTVSRFQEIGRAQIEGVDLPAFDLPARRSRQSTLVLSTWLGWPPFAK